ncbi:hypothetical protein B0H13DRAFT_1857236 [Mycena leptocephala]|nr:hypothetical protein B0H13DRAFT_1857236 [Mycena leptocephala]
MAWALYGSRCRAEQVIRAATLLRPDPSLKAQRWYLRWFESPASELRGSASAEMLDTIDPSREMICGSVDYFHRTDISLPVSNNYESRRIHFSGMDVEGGGSIAVGDEEVPRTGGNTLAHALSWPLGLRRKPTKCAEHPTLASRDTLPNAANGALNGPNSSRSSGFSVSELVRDVNLYLHTTKQYDDYSWGKWLSEVRRIQQSEDIIYVYSTRATKYATRELEQAFGVDRGNSRRNLLGFPAKPLCS